MNKPKKRVIVYIDGFNLYFGLRAKYGGRYLWLNLQDLAKNLLKSDQELVFTKYFTTRISSPPDKQKRQSTFIEALETLEYFQIYYGYYLLNQTKCRVCGNKSYIHSEKMTDVNIAVELLTYAFHDKFDIAMLISADSDLVPLLKSLKKLYPFKRVIVTFPPKRSSKELMNVANVTIRIDRSTLSRSLFPEQVKKPDKFILHRPPTWI